MSKYDDIVKQTVIEILEEILYINENDKDYWNTGEVYETIKKRLCEKYNVVVD